MKICSGQCDVLLISYFCSDSTFPMHLHLAAFYLFFLFKLSQGRAEYGFIEKYSEIKRSRQSLNVLQTPILFHRYKRSENETKVSTILPSENNAGQPTQKTSIKKELTKQEHISDNLHTSGADIIAETELKSNKTVAQNETSLDMDKNSNQLKPGTLRRGIIVFGSLTFLFIVYMTYKIWRKSTDTNKENYLSESPLFKYGVLKTDENSEHMELARMPLTVDSEDDDDLEIFDLEHNKRMQTNSRINYSAIAKDDIQILDLELPIPNSHQNQDRNFVLLDLNNDSFSSKSNRNDSIG